MVSLTSDFLNHLKSRLVASHIIGQTVKLKRQGRHLLGLCPFHQEKTPSFTVNDDQGNYHCFGCGAHGDIIEFTKLIDHLSFKETIEKLASIAGISLPSSLSVSSENIQHRNEIYQILEQATLFFQNCLKSNAGNNARKYLEKRQINSDSIEKFRLGYAPDHNELKTFFADRHISENLLHQAGLLNQKENRPSYDRFRDRLIFPIADQKGRIIAFGGRILNKEEPKYLNSPDTDLFHKGSIVYAHHLAKSHKNEGQQIIVCEGYLDVISLYQAGLPFSVSPLGTALTDIQINLLWTLSPEPILCFDGDIAGQKAAQRVTERVLPCLKSGFSLKFAHLPKGEDPDSLIQNGSLSQLKNILLQALPLEDMLWNQTMIHASIDSPEGRAKFETNLLDLTGSIKDPILKNHYRKTFKNRLFHFFRFERYQNSKSLKSSLKSQKKISFDALLIQQKILFAGLLNYPNLIEIYYEKILDLNLTTFNFIQLRDIIILKINDESGLDILTLQTHLYKKGYKDFIDAILSEDVYQHATFVRPQQDIIKVREGWLEVWAHFQNSTSEEEIPLLSASKSLFPSLSPLLKTKIRQNHL